MRVLIDAGHGIDTPGKRSPDGAFLEYLFNRSIAEKVYSVLEEQGWDVDLVVNETNDVALKTRVRRVNDVCRLVGSHNVLLLSIHSNAAGNGKNWMDAQGFECYTTKGKTRSDIAAQGMYAAFSEVFPGRRMRMDLSDGDKDKESDFYIIRHTSCPAVLLECFFYDNKEECRWLLKEETHWEIARAIVKGIGYYHGSEYH